MGFGVVVLVVGFVGGWVVEIFLLMWVVVVGYGEDGCGFFFFFGIWILCLRDNIIYQHEDRSKANFYRYQSHIHKMNDLLNVYKIPNKACILPSSVM